MLQLSLNEIRKHRAKKVGSDRLERKISISFSNDMVLNIWYANRCLFLSCTFHCELLFHFVSQSFLLWSSLSLLKSNEYHLLQLRNLRHFYVATVKSIWFLHSFQIIRSKTFDSEQFPLSEQEASCEDCGEDTTKNNRVD